MSPRSAPVVIVPKKLSLNGVVTHRMCINYRELNSSTVPEVYPLPDTHETLDMLGGKGYADMVFCLACLTEMQPLLPKTFS
ncbi:hypothetical protein J6590_092774 [Homalodisca vitripennis]|nr:hypothetical protein J6590_092774 [Homalodisca vitripennis]